VLAGIPRPDNILNYYFSGKVPIKNKLQCSACIRALPKFYGDTAPFIDECLRRWTVPRPRPDLTEWNEWITKWVTFYRPKRMPDFYPISLGSSACLEYTREEGGLKRGFLELMKLPLSKERDKQFQSDLTKIKMKSLMSVDLTPFRRSFYLIYACLTALEPAIIHSKKCDGCKNPSLHPPMCILALRERGFKVRLPTMTVSPLVILAKILRQVADAYLRSDSRIRNSLEGNFLHTLNFKTKGLWRSQDLTVATDYHHRDMTRKFYELINPGVTWWQDAVSVVCNYYTIFPQSELLSYRIIKGSLKPFYFNDLPIFHKDKLFQRLYGDYLRERVNGGTEYIDVHWDNIHSRHGKVSCQGQPMGVSTSWALLPLVSLFAFEKSSTKKIKTIERQVYAVLDSFDKVNLSLVFDNKQKKITLKRDVPSNFNCIQTTGDDAIMRVTLDQSKLHTSKLESLGGIVSSTKDFLSNKFAIYTEIFYEDGKSMNIWPVGPLLAPESTRQCTWYSQPRALKVIEKNFIIKIPLQFSKFYYHWKFLAELGCPIWAPEPLGGLGLNLNYPIGFRKLGKRVQYLMYEELKTVLRLHPGLPQKDLYKLGLIERPPRSAKESSLSILQSMKDKWSDIYDSPMDLSVETFYEKTTVTVPSPEIILPLEIYDQIYRSQFTWDQHYATHYVDPEPSMLSFIHRFDSFNADLSLAMVEDLYEEYVREEKTINVPWGLFMKFKPLFGLLLPRTHSPVFYYNNRLLDMRTSVIEF